MAERTGIPTLDELLLGFERDGQVYLSGADLDKPVSAWRHCDAGNAACHAISETFVDYLAEHAVDAALSDEVDRAEFADTADSLGYTDRPVLGAPWHTVTLVYEDDDVFAVDWSAHQFGYSEFPLVQRYDTATGTWQRDWEAASDA